MNAPQPVHLLGRGSGTSRVKRPGGVVPLDSWAPHGCLLLQDAQRLSAKNQREPSDHCLGISSPFLGEATCHLSSEVWVASLLEPRLYPQLTACVCVCVCVCVSHSVVTPWTVARPNPNQLPLPTPPWRDSKSFLIWARGQLSFHMGYTLS